MGDEVTCGICQRPLDPLDGKCGSDEAECLRIGYDNAAKVALELSVEVSEQKARAEEWYARWQQDEEALAAARRECELLTSSVVHLRLVGTQMATFIEEQMPLFGGSSSEFDGTGEPREILKRWRKADKIADKSYGPAALAAPAAGRDPATEDADAAWRDGEAHGRDK